jgi:hypothetical protein
MFPLATIDAGLIHPLTPSGFIQQILVPEVGMRLVSEDMDLDLRKTSDKEQPVAILGESASYGVGMFPDDGGAKGANEKAMAIAEQMFVVHARVVTSLPWTADLRASTLP